MKFYKVKAVREWEYVIQLDEDEDAHTIAKFVVEQSEDYDAPPATIRVESEIHNQHELPEGWNGDCLAYCSDPFKYDKIKDYLK